MAGNGCVMNAGGCVPELKIDVGSFFTSGRGLVVGLNTLG